MSDQSPASTSNMNRALRDNIETLSGRARQEAIHAPLSHRIARPITAFAGSMVFVVVHLVLYGSWIFANVSGLPGVPRFDPSLVFLSTTASVEAIFLSTFVLISQNRMADTAARNADLDLHISLLTEHELTRLAVLTERIARRLEIPVDDLELDEIEADVEPTEVLDVLDEKRAVTPC